MLHVREFVRDHALEFVVRQQTKNAFGRRHGRMIRSTTSREGIWRLIRNDVDLRHRQLRPLCQTRDDGVEAGLGAGLLCAVHRQDDLVREPVRREVRHHRKAKTDDKALRAAQLFAEKQKQRTHRAEEKRGLQSVRHRYM